MKSIIALFIAALLILSVSAVAQSKVTQQERLKNLKQRLSLTDEQYVKVEQILTKSSDEIQKLRASGNPDREGFKKIRDESNQKILNILDEKQKSEINKMLNERIYYRH